MSLPPSQSTGLSQTVVDANPPFSGETKPKWLPEADLILRSTVEGAVSVDFHVHKAALYLVSEVFRDMLTFEAPKKTEELKDGKPIVLVQDSSSALEILLPLCYPFLGNSRPTTLDGVEEALVAAEKYDIAPAVEVLGSVLMNFVETEPYCVFGIALRRKMACARVEDVAAMGAIVNAAALKTLEQPFLARRNDIVVSDAALLLQLYDFCTKCGTAAANLAKEYAHWILYDNLPPPPEYRMNGPDRTVYGDAVWWSGHRYHDNGCGATIDPDFPPEAPTIFYPTHWFTEHMKQVAEALNICPTETQVGKTVLDLRGTMYQLKCTKCAERHLRTWKSLCWGISPAKSSQII
jgi:hypothetical protein